MLVEFSVTNFRSIRERQALSMVASTLKDKDSNVFESAAPGVDRLLRTAVIYGANAAGKSNFLRALDVMQDIVLLSARESQSGEELPVVPFRLGGSDQEPTTFEIVFVVNSVKYEYGFSCTSRIITEEWLNAYPEKRTQRWFARSYRPETEDYDWNFGPQLKGAKKAWAAATRKNALFLSAAVQLNAEQLEPIFQWFRNKLRPVVGTGEIGDKFSTDLLAHADSRGGVVALLANADSGIVDLDVVESSLDENVVDMLNKIVPENLRESVLSTSRKKVRAMHRNAELGSPVWFDMSDESQGTRKMFAFAGPFLDVLAHGLVLVVDELNNSLHPMLVRSIVETFNNPRTNRLGAQLIFATHATSILSTEIFRRDQIWFAEKRSDMSTCLYSLLDFNPRKSESLSKGYLQGRYGAIPFLSGELVDG